MVGLAGAAVLAACGSASTSSASSTTKVSPTLTIGVDNGSPTLQDDFNPFSGNQRIGTTYMYEPLAWVNPLQGTTVPLLAASEHFTNPTTLVVTLRSGMKWSNGAPITPADVVFTFDMLKQYPALDGAGIWDHVSSVTSSGSTITFTFTAPDVPFAQSILETPIVPKSVWSSVSNPVTFTNTNPVVSGPFVLKSFNPNEYVLAKNPDFWDASSVEVKTINFPALTGNQTSQLTLAQGGYDWATLFIPDVQKVWVAKDPATNKYWFPSGGEITLFLNLAKAPFSSVAFRQGISAALDRSTIATKAEDGYVPVASQTGLLLPNLKQWLDPAIPNSGYVSYDPTAALADFAKAGYHLSGGKLTGPSGAVSMSIIVPNGFSDWIEAAQVISQELAKVGISVTLQTPEYAAYASDLSTGSFTGAIGAFGGTGNPYNDLHGLLAASLAAPLGQTAASNYERWVNPTTETYLHALAAAVTTSAQRNAVYGLEQQMVNDVPVVVLYQGAIWSEFSTKNFVGWPSAQDPYAPPQPYGQAPLVIMTHLRLR
ncbi:extracellular solute-binding protein family 5 [Acidimicrobium ferrooxidans DSM 10331]|uniref:Extracellular solute-binding protein family 5 n=2 Tax=Acidimicrobium ferrooxidans TaxID=53635 RepID=C7M242_ACIFD|nr:extracellular solute-binding protein family 5 [Acidimicrobium ferrooxidans DSM 10331]